MERILSPQRLRVRIMSIPALWARSTLFRGSYQSPRIYTGTVHSSYNTESSSPLSEGDSHRRAASMSVTNA